MINEIFGHRVQNWIYKEDEHSPDVPPDPLLSLMAPSAGLYNHLHHLQWAGPQVTAVLRLALPGGGCHDTVDAAQHQLRNIVRHQTSILLAILSPPFFLLLCLTSSYHRP